MADDSAVGEVFETVVQDPFGLEPWDEAAMAMSMAEDATAEALGVTAEDVMMNEELLKLLPEAFPYVICDRNHEDYLVVAVIRIRFGF